MRTKGVVYVPCDGQPGWQGEAPGLQLVVNRPMVCHVLDALAADAVDEVGLVAAPEALPAIREAIAADPTITSEPVYLPLGERRDLGGAVTAARPFVDQAPAVVHLATGLLGQPLAPLLHADRDTTELLLLLHRSRCDDRGGLCPATERLLGVSDFSGEGPRLGLAEVAIFGPDGLARTADSLSVDDHADRNGRLPEQHPLVGLAERAVDAGLGVAAGIVRGWSRYSTAPADLLELNRSVLDRQAAEAGPPSGADNQIEGRVVIHPTADVSSSIILGPCQIGAGARIADSYIGPYTTIGPHTILEGAEIIRSVVAEGARISHVAGRIEGSTIGRGAQIFRDLTLPRAMRLHVGENVEVALD